MCTNSTLLHSFLFIIISQIVLISKGDEKHVSFLRLHFNLTVWNSLRQQIRCQTEHGYWTKEVTDTTNTFNKTSSAQSPCDRNHKLNPYAQQGRCSSIFNGSSLSYSWKASEKMCTQALVKFDAPHFCRIMHQRVQGNILFVGDSIQHEFAAEFTSALHIELGNLNPQMNCRTCYNRCDAQVMHPQYCLKDANSYANYFNLSISRNDHLHTNINTDRYSDNETKLNHSPWVQTLKSHNIGLLLMNRGAHFKPTVEVLSELNVTLSEVFIISPEISVVWRNTNPGHHDYAEKFFSPPLNAAPSNNDSNLVKYHWNDFDGQNREIEQFLSEFFPQVLYLDFSSPTALRADSHVDYLHYCIPGPLSLWPILLYNALKIIDDFASLATPK